MIEGANGFVNGASNGPIINGSEVVVSVKAHRKSLEDLPLTLELCDDDLRFLMYGKKIAEGTTSDVYKGSFKGNVVAIKRFKMESGMMNANMERVAYPIEMFLQEVRLLGSLIGAPHVVQYRGFYRGGNHRPFLLLTEYLKGTSLYDVLHLRKFRVIDTLRKILDVLLPLADAMECLHKNDILHRDLKPSNVLITSEGIIKVIDFGLARVEDPDGDMTGQTGSYRWSAPEVLRREHYTQKADVYSYGIVAWEVATSKVPYYGLKPVQTAMLVANEGIRPSLLQPKPSCPEELCALIHQTWEEDPDKRPSFSEIVVSLRSIEQKYQKSEDRHESMQMITDINGEPRVFAAFGEWAKLLVHPQKKFEMLGKI